MQMASVSEEFEKVNVQEEFYTSFPASENLRAPKAIF